MKSKYYKFVIISALLLVAQISKVNAQGGLKCGTDEKMRELYASHPEMLQQQIDYNNSLKEIIKNMKFEKAAEAQHIIPVVFHIIHCNGPENLPDANIYDAINVINTDWNKLNTDLNQVIGYGTANNPFDTIMAKMNFKFRLATIDPNGNCTNGIDRIYSHLTYNADDNSKLNQWPRDKYLNIWVIHDFKTAASGVQPAAYAYFPSGASGWMAQYDGVISLYDYIGSLSPSNVTNSRTLTHEIGHYFNLEHPWSTAGDITDPARPCGDDGVDDTPYTKGHLTCDKTPHCELDTINLALPPVGSLSSQFVYNFNSITSNSGTTDTASTLANSFVTFGHFNANGVSSSAADSALFSYTQLDSGTINGSVISMHVDSMGTGYEIGDTFNPNGGTGSLAVGTVSRTQIASVTLLSSGVGYSPSDIATFVTTGTGTQATATVLTTKVVGTPVLTFSGTNYSVNDTLRLKGGVGTKAKIVVDAVNGSGAITTFHLETAGVYTTNPIMPADTVTGGTGTGAIFTITTGINTYSLSGGNYSLSPSLTTVSATTSGSAVTTSATWSIDALGVKAVTFTGGVYNLNLSTNFPILLTGATNITGSGMGLQLTSTLGPNVTGSINTSKYYEFTVTPKWGHSMTPASITFDVKRNMTGVRSFAVRSSVNNFTSNLPASIVPANPKLGIQGTNEFFYMNDTDLVLSGCKITLSGANYTDLLTPVKFRFYGWNSEDSLTGSFGIDNVKLTDVVGLIEDYQNFMDYSYCDNHFTEGQKTRVRAAAASPVSYRSNLWINSNLTATGTQDPYPTGVVCVPSPDFYSNRIQICAGSSVTFTAINSNVTQGSSVTRLWTFQNGTGTPTTSALASPTVTYTTPGDYDVTLALSSTSGTGTTTKSSYIHVYQPWAQYNGNLVENFESPASSYWNWILNNYDGNPHAWGLFSGAGYSGSHSMVMNGFENYSDDVDDFITPGFNLYLMSNSVLSFRCAAASSALVATDLTDVLKVYASKDCGQTWTAMSGSTFQGTALCNNGYYAGSFFPTSQSQWALHTINISSSYNVPNLKFKFEYITGNASNNIFIDDINVNGTVGIAENTLAENNFSLYPNPSNETTTVFYHLNSKGNVKIELIDLLGKKVMEIANTNQGEGDYYYNVSKLEHNLNNGIYFVKFTLDGNSTTKKLIFTQ